MIPWVGSETNITNDLLLGDLDVPLPLQHRLGISSEHLVCPVSITEYIQWFKGGVANRSW
jgi:hypothetical protein